MNWLRNLLFIKIYQNERLKGLYSFNVVILALPIIMLSGCDVFEKTYEKAWQNHAFEKKRGNQVFWLSEFSTYRECIENTEWYVNRPPNNEWYSEPIGCVYRGSSLMKTILFNYWAGSRHNQCIIQFKDPEIIKLGMRYGIQLKGYTEHKDAPCVF